VNDNYLAMFLGISAGDWLSAATLVAVTAWTLVTARRSTWHSSVDKELAANKDRHTIYDRKFQRLKDKHNLDTTIED
jgi:hypothetical protein